MTVIDLTRPTTDHILADLARYLIDKANRLADEILVTADPEIGWRLLHQLEDLLQDHALVLGMLRTG